MLKAKIQIDDELAVKGFKRALRSRALKDISYFYAWRLTIVWLVVSFVDALFGEGQLMNWHLVTAFGLWVAAMVYSYAEWSKTIDLTKGWSFEAVLDETGVKTSHLSDENINSWDFYKSYQEFEDYLEIKDINGGISFLPKTPELFEVIEFTKNKIAGK